MKFLKVSVSMLATLAVPAPNEMKSGPLELTSAEIEEWRKSLADRYGDSADIQNFEILSADVVEL